MSLLMSFSRENQTINQEQQIWFHLFVLKENNLSHVRGFHDFFSPNKAFLFLFILQLGLFIPTTYKDFD